MSERHVYVLDETGGYRNTLERRYRIETLNGVQDWAETGAGWSPWFQKRPRIQATVTSPERKVLGARQGALRRHRVRRDLQRVVGATRSLRRRHPTSNIAIYLELAALAEHYGMPDDARAAYRRVVPENAKPTDSTQRLAERRLAALPRKAAP